MANTILTTNQILNETLMILHNKLAFARNVNRSYDGKFGITGAKVGNTVNVRKPVRFQGTLGPNLNLENVVETTVPVVLDTQFHVDFAFSSTDLTLSIDQFSDRYLKPAVATLANRVDLDGLQMAKNTTYNQSGTPGTTPAGIDPYLDAGVLLDNMACPRDGFRNITMNPRANATLISALKGVFNPTDAVSRQNRSGLMGEDIYGFDWTMDQNIVTHQTGPLGGTPLVNGANQNGSTLILDGWTASAGLRLRQGDVFTIAGVNAVNPQSRQDTGQLQQFVALTDLNSDAAGNMTASIAPAINPTGQYQNVTNSPADNAAITVSGTANQKSPQNMAYHRDAYVLATADLDMPEGGVWGGRKADPETGLSVRIVKQYAISNDTTPVRLDILYGWRALYPELGVRVAG